MPNPTVPANGRPMPERTRQRMERAIEMMIATLDALDGDVDREPDNDNEPYLGWSIGMGHGGTDDLECDWSSVP